MTGRQPYDVYAKLEDPMGVLSVALGQWERRDDSKAQPEVRRASNTAMDALDTMLGELHAMRSRLVGEIRDADDATAARVDALLAGRQAAAVITDLDPPQAVLDRMAARGLTELTAARAVLDTEEVAGETQVTTYTHPDVLTTGITEGWAEAETDPTRIGWPARQAAAAIPCEVTGGRPVNPCASTGIRHGRNELGLWGENLMADALVTVTLPPFGARYLLMVERGDGYGWAVPGGAAETGETAVQAAVRELAEETGLDARGWPFTVCREMPPRYVPDPRSSDEAWPVTIPVHIDLGTRDALPGVTGADDANLAEWIPADSYGYLADALEDRYGGQVFAAHVAMLRDFLGGVS